MTIYLIDGSLEHFLSVLRHARRDDQFYDEDGPVPALLGTSLWLAPDEAATQSMLAQIEGTLGTGFVDTLLHIHASEEAERYNLMAGYIARSLRAGRDCIEQLQDPLIAACHAARRATSRELHRMLGLLRFRVLPDDSLYAELRPDHAILPLLGPHFSARFPEERWLIHDRRRGMALLYADGERLLLPLSGALPQPQEGPDPYADAWRLYHRTIAIPERRNRRLQQQFIPLKRRAELTEFNDAPPRAGAAGGQPARLEYNNED